jgi:flagellar hook-associated protein 1
MASDLLSIAQSGVRVARGALDVTAQNIANAATEGYVRRSLRVEEVSSAGGFNRNDMSLSGARIAGITRNADMFRQTEVRRTSGEAARGAAELQGLENIESAIEQSRVYDLAVEFEASLLALSADPTDLSLRASTMAAAGNMASGFGIAANSLDAVGEGLRFEASAGVDEANTIMTELSRVNLRMARSGESSSDRATLLDQRDSLLERLAGKVDISTSFTSSGMVEVRLGSGTGPVMISGGTAGTLAAVPQADGTLDFTLDGTAVTVAGGGIGGKAQALDALLVRRTALDTAAVNIMTTVNTAQTNGAALNGAAGAALFSGTGAGDMALAFTNGTGLATAPAGSPAGSTDSANLTALRNAFSASGHAQELSDLIFAASADVAGKSVTSEALGSIASAARIALEQQSGVDLDQEAANLVRFQQAFQASSRAMQVASDIFDTLLGIR